MNTTCYTSEKRHQKALIMRSRVKDSFKKATQEHRFCPGLNCSLAVLSRRHSCASATHRKRGWFMVMIILCGAYISKAAEAQHCRVSEEIRCKSQDLTFVKGARHIWRAQVENIQIFLRVFRGGDWMSCYRSCHHKGMSLWWDAYNGVVPPISQSSAEPTAVGAPCYNRKHLELVWHAPTCQPSRARTVWRSRGRSGTELRNGRD